MNPFLACTFICNGQVSKSATHASGRWIRFAGNYCKQRRNVADSSLFNVEFWRACGWVFIVSTQRYECCSLLECLVRHVHFYRISCYYSDTCGVSSIVVVNAHIHLHPRWHDQLLQVVYSWRSYSRYLQGLGHSGWIRLNGVPFCWIPIYQLSTSFCDIEEKPEVRATIWQCPLPLPSTDLTSLNASSFQAAGASAPGSSSNFSCMADRALWDRSW